MQPVRRDESFTLVSPGLKQYLVGKCYNAGARGDVFRRSVQEVFENVRTAVSVTGPPKNPRGRPPQTSGPVDSTCSSGSSVQTMAIAAARHARDADKQAQRAQPPLPAGVSSPWPS